MRQRSRFVAGLAAAALLALCGCCTFLGSQGGGPVARAELGAWAGVPLRSLPDRPVVEARVRALRRIINDPMSGEFVHSQGVSFAPTDGAMVRRSGHPWTWVLPGRRYTDVLVYDPGVKDSREFLGTVEGWGLGGYVGDYLHAWRQLTLHDVTSGRPVAAKRFEVYATPLAYARSRLVWPAAPTGQPAVLAATHPGVDLADVPCVLRDGTAVLGGLIGWGRVNRVRYIQALWLPVPMGSTLPR